MQLAGGNDGLNTVVPVGDSTYHSVRKAIGFKDEEILPLESGLGLAPQLTGLKGLWDGGKLADRPRRRLPEPELQPLQVDGDLAGRRPGTQAPERLAGPNARPDGVAKHDPFLGFNIGASTPPGDARADKVSIPSVQDIADYGFQKAGKIADSASDPRTATLMKLYEQYPAAVAVRRAAGNDRGERP